MCCYQIETWVVLFSVPSGCTLCGILAWKCLVGLEGYLTLKSIRRNVDTERNSNFGTYLEYVDQLPSKIRYYSGLAVAWEVVNLLCLLVMLEYIW